MSEGHEALAAVAPYAPPIERDIPYCADGGHKPATQVIAELREWRSKPLVDIKPE
jgi:hypothetical protein